MVGKIVELERSADEICGQISVDLAVDREEDPVREVALLEFLLEDDDPVREPSDIAQVQFRVGREPGLDLRGFPIILVSSNRYPHARDGGAEVVGVVGAGLGESERKARGVEIPLQLV